MSVSPSFDFSKFDYAIDPTTGSIDIAAKKSKKDLSDRLITLLENCQKELETKQVSVPLTNINQLSTFTRELQAFLAHKQISAKTPYRLRQRPQDKILEKQITALKKLESDFATLSLRGIVKKVAEPTREIQDILSLGKTLRTTSKQTQTTQLFQEGKNAFITALLQQSDLTEVIRTDASFEWLNCFLHDAPTDEAAQQLLESLGSLRQNDTLPDSSRKKIQGLIETFDWLKQRVSRPDVTSAQRLFTAFLIEVKLPSRPKEPYLKEVLQQGFIDCIEGASNFSWIKDFLAESPTDKEINDLQTALKTALSSHLLSRETKTTIGKVAARFDALSQEIQTAKLSSLIRLQMAYTSQLFTPANKDEAVENFFSENIERLFSSQGSLEWIKRFLQEKPSNAEVAEIIKLLEFVSKCSLANSQLTKGSKMLLKSYDELGKKEQKLSHAALLGLAYGIEIHLSKKEDPLAKQLLQEGLGRLFAIEGSLKGLSGIISQKPTKAQVFDLISLLEKIAFQSEIGEKERKTLQELLKTYAELNKIGTFSPQEMLKVAYALQVDSSLVKDETLFKRALIALMQNSQNTLALEPLLKQDMPIEQLTSILELFKSLEIQQVTLTKIINRFEQLTKVPQEQLRLTPQEILQLAYFIEVRLAKVVQTSGAYIKKGQEKTEAMTRSLLVNPESGDVFVLSKRKVEVLDASGTFKRVTSAIRLPVSVQAELVAQAVGKHDDALSKPRDYEEQVILGKNELETHKELNKGPGIWPLLYWCEYTKTLAEDNKIPKITAIYAFADGNLSRLQETLEGEPLLIASNWLIEGLAYMHALGFVHGDLKLDNALFKYDADGNLLIGWSDFGLTKNLSKGQKPDIAFVTGFYGTPIYTPPEVFGKENYDGDFQKADVWALGCCLYQLCFKEQLPWAEFIQKYHQEPSLITEETQTFFTQTMEEIVAQELDKLPPIEEQTKIEKLKALLFQMLRPDPAVRMDMQTAKAEIKKLL